jgi:hypothetical protein
MPQGTVALCLLGPRLHYRLLTLCPMAYRPCAPGPTDPVALWWQGTVALCLRARSPYACLALAYTIAY